MPDEYKAGHYTGWIPEKWRELFLLYLKPIINGTGNYYIETQTRDQTRTDVIVYLYYLGQQYIIELKIWRGERYNSEGVKQVHVGDRILFEAMV